ncbi:MAG: type III-A CRISPR-associated RAMP protein Csm5 [[Clostridium] aminophilum]|uniref:type III-A CRISPR-associated RAMP protein Csm5 n=1 Tax=[Clostridium] aminophilum TaxID=1526 RepID=UPI0026F145C5|nr:type III-A CRISPR-associated RAMP protein Csm5 [[Clostridium] aminophilum]MDD6196592.1 type III-A CRISPR-associated RAMP protein Csm5 [[Clostridium] aminophilum]
MKEYLREYDVELETIGPLFIGSGYELNKKEYLFGNDDIKVMDIPRLFSFFEKKGLRNRFESFFLDDVRKDLFRFLRENSIRTDDVSDCIKYRIKQSDTSLERGKPAAVMEFVKDPYGLPYLPGSSIKGMLRTILLASEIALHDNQYVTNKEKIRDSLYRGGNRNTLLRKEVKDIETTAFHKLGRNKEKKDDSVNDVLSGLVISDSQPLNLDDLVLCQRVEYHVDGEEKHLNLLRECIKPGTKIHFKMTIDSLICPYGKEDIINAIRFFNKNYNEVFRNVFPKFTPGKPDSVYLGGGTGFVSKTVIYPLFGKQNGIDVTVNVFGATKVPRNHKHNLDRQIGVSPHILKMTYYYGKMFHMGECRWRFC